MADARTLDLVINAETEAARQQLKELAAVTGQTAEKVDAGLAKIEDAISNVGKGGGLLAGFAGGIGAGLVEHIGEIGHAFIEASERALEYAGDLQKVAERTGTTTTFLQQYRYAALQNDVAVDAADKGLEQFNRTIGLAATGNTRAVTTFKALGVSVTDQAGAIKPLDVVYREVADAISKIASPSEQAARAQQLFKETGLDLLPLLRQGAAGFDEYTAAAAKLGIVLGPEQIAQAAAAEQKFKDIKEVLSVEFASAITANADSLLQLADAFKSAADGAARFFATNPGALRGIGLTAAGAAAGMLIGPEGAVLGAAAGAAYAAHLDAKDADVKLRKTSAANIINLLPKGSPERTAAEAQYAKDYPQTKTAKPGSARPVDDAAQRVLERLGAKVATGGDPRALAIAQALTEAGVTADSDIGKRIAAAAGTNYDQTGGKRAGESAARRADADARRAAAEKQRALREAAAADRDVVQARRAFDAAEVNAADTPEARYALATKNVGNKLDDSLTVIGDKRASGKLSALQAKEEETLARQVAVDEQIVVDRNEQARKVAEQLTSLETDLGIDRDQLQVRLALATTAGERRTIQLALLDLEEKELRAQQQKVIDDPTSSPKQRSDAQKKLAGIDATAGGRREAALRDSEGPLAAYARSINKTSAQMDEAIQNVEVDGLKSLSDGLLGVITGTESVGQAFKHMADMIISDLARIVIEQEIIGPLAALLGLGGGGGGFLSSLFGGGGGAAAGAASGSIDAFAFPGYANGGVPRAGEISLVGENGPELIVGNGVARVVPFAPASPGMARGGGGGGSTTTVVNNNQSLHFDVGLESVDSRIAQAAPILLGAAQKGTIAALKNAGIGQV